jgi:hypothetical protein
MVDVQTVSIAVASAGVVAGSFTMHSKSGIRLRQTHLIMRLHSQACSKESIEAYQNISSMEFKDYSDS